MKKILILCHCLPLIRIIYINLYMKPLRSESQNHTIKKGPKKGLKKATMLYNYILCCENFNLSINITIKIK